MAWLRKTRGVPGGAPGGYVWTTTEDVVEVPEELASVLVEIPDAGFITVPEPEPTKEEVVEAPTPAAAKKAVSAKSAAKTQVQE